MAEVGGDGPIPLGDAACSAAARYRPVGEYTTVLSGLRTPAPSLCCGLSVFPIDGCSAKIVRARVHAKEVRLAVTLDVINDDGGSSHIRYLSSSRNPENLQT